MVQISVIDSGSGISEANQKKLMQPFFTTKEVGKGIGLGLSISLSIVHSHGGRLYYNPQSANTCFIVELPVAERSSQEIARWIS